MSEAIAEAARSSAQIIAGALYDAGCRNAFGIPGGEVLSLMDALGERGIDVTLVKHENCAGFMGEGVWHHDGAPAILFATIGPGVANAVNTIANAWQDRVPMIVLTGCVPAVESHTYTHQVFDHVDLLKPITKAVFRVEHGTAAVVIDKALNIAATGRPGPVVLDVPIDVQRALSDTWHRSNHKPQSAMAPSGPDLEKARSWLSEAQKPIVIAGLDVLVQRAEETVADFCRSMDIPLITTYKAKGLIPETDPLSLGGAGLSPVCDKELLPVVAQSDCVILAGYDPIEMRIGWQDPFGENDRVIEIAAETNTHYMHQATLNFSGDIAASLGALSDDLQIKDHWPDQTPKQVKQRLMQVLDRNAEWGPVAVADEARKACPDDTIITVDSGAHRIVLSQVWQCYEPRSMLQSTALCTMGCAVPLAIGRKLAEPSRPVMAFVGDAGLEMFMGELATLRDLKLAIPILVFVDEQLALIELKQRGLQMPTLGVEFPGTDFDSVATALGGYGVTVKTRDQLNREIKDALDRDRFTLISAAIGKNAYDGLI